MVPPSLSADDFLITDARYGHSLPLVQCAACGFVYAYPMPPQDILGLYQSLEDPEYLSGRAYRLRQMRGLVQRMRRDAPEARSLLDVGAGSGLLVEAAADLGLDAVGVEPARSLVADAHDHGLRVHEGVLPHPELAGERFDLVTCIDVIEHVPDPVGLLTTLGDHVAEGGRLVLVTPDVESVAARTLGGRWWHYRLAHIGFLTRQATREALDRAGLVEVSRARPVWWFSAAYLTQRVGALTGTARLTTKLDRPGVAGVLERLTLPLDLRDSWMIVCRRA